MFEDSVSQLLVQVLSSWYIFIWAANAFENITHVLGRFVCKNNIQTSLSPSSKCKADMNIMRLLERLVLKTLTECTSHYIKSIPEFQEIIMSFHFVHLLFRSFAHSSQRMLV